MKQKLLITGAGGYIGSITTQLLLQHGYEVIAIDNFSTGFRKPLKFLQSAFGKKQLRWYEEDIDNINKIVSIEKNIQAVFHFAASTIVDESMKNPSKYFSNNTCACVKLLETMVEYNIKNIIFSSTAAVYGQSQYIPIDESHPTIPESPYGASKYATERIISWYKSLGINNVILRYFNVCGASDDGRLGNAQDPSIALVQNAIKGALNIMPFELTCAKVNTPDKTPIRDYINVVDLANAHMLALEYLLSNNTSNIINLGTETGYSVLEIIKTVEQITKTTITIKQGHARKGECAKVVASSKKARELLGWRPEHTLEQSIKSTIQWIKEH